MVTPTMPWSFSTGRLMTASQVRVRVFESRLPALPKMASSVPYPASSLPMQRIGPCAPRSVAGLLQVGGQAVPDDHLRGGMPACWRRSQTASTRRMLVDPPRPERQFTFKPTTSSGRAMAFQASSGESRL